MASTSSHGLKRSTVVWSAIECGSGGVDAVGAALDGGQAVGHAHRQVVVAVETQLAVRFQRRAYGAESGLHVIGQHGARRVGDVDAVGAVAFHQQSLLDQALSAVHVRHHQEAHGVQVQLARQRDVLFADVGLGAVGGHADGVHAQVLGHAQMVHGADAGKQQGRDLGALHQRDHGAQVLLVAVCREAVVDRTAAQAVAVRDLDQRDARLVEPGGYGPHLSQRHLVALGVHAVAQRHVVHGDLAAFECALHGLISFRRR